LGLADSAYNELRLQEAGYERTGVLPIAIDEAHYDLVDNALLAAQLDVEGPTLLFVGRLAPNKKQEDLVKLLFCYRRISPSARLLLVGDRWTVGYDRWVEQLAQELELGHAVKLTGKVSQQDLVTCYRHSHLYISMSEHEGFGKPLVESMVLGLPVLAYAAAAVPYTLGRAGVQFHQKDFERLAELVDILVEDGALRQRIIDAQREKVNDYLAPQLRRQFIAYLERSLA
jgi:glycosyltransferase involved in cell wall biosynthesis